MVCLSPANVEVFSCSWKSISPSPFLSTSLAEAWLLAFSKSAWEILRRYSSTKPQPDQELMIGYYMVLHAITYSIPKYTGLLQHVLIVLNATAESPLSFQHLGVHWGRSAPRLWLHHRSRPPAGWWAATDGIRFQHAAQPCGSAKCQIFKDSQDTYATFIYWCHLVPVHQASCLHPPVPAHHGWWCPSRLCQRPCAKNWSRCGLGVSKWGFP